MRAETCIIMTHKNTSLDSLSVSDLRARRSALARQLPDVEGLVRGSLQRQFRRCGRAGCRCTRGELHGPYVYLAVRTKERRGLVYVSTEVAPEVERMVNVTGRIEETMAEISAINIELLARGELG